jgi:glycosyltransferase involved in cell wall biosynthesis
LITERFYPEDFGINDLALEWKKRGSDLSVLSQAPSYPHGDVYSGYKNRLFQKTVWRGIPVFRVFSLMGYQKNVVLKILNYLCFALLASIVAIFLARKFDKIFVYQVGPLTQGIPGVLLKKIFKKKLIIWTLDIWPDSVFAYGFKENAFVRTLLEIFVRIVYKNCDLVFVSCKGFVNRIQNYAPEVKVVYFPQWVPDELKFEGNNQGKALSGSFNFTFAGNIGKVQNLENIIEGFKPISDTYQNVCLNFIGDGSYLSNLKRLTEEKKVSNVSFWGRKPIQEMPEWFAASDVLVISLIDKPIFSITVPAKFQAYLAAGKPIFCVMNGEVADLVIDHHIGLVAHPDDLDDIRSGYERFLSMPGEELDSMTVNMKHLLDAEFDRETLIQEKTELLMQI